MLVDNRSDSGVELVDYQEVETMGLETGATVCTYIPTRYGGRCVARCGVHNKSLQDRWSDACY